MLASISGRDLLSEIIDGFDKCRGIISYLLQTDSTVLYIKDEDTGNNLLIKACFNGKADLVSKILSSQYCTKEVLMHKNNSGNNALITSCINMEECAVEILRSKFCDSGLLEEIDAGGESCLMIACNNTPSLVKYIIESPHFSRSTLSYKSSDKNALMHAFIECLPDEVIASLVTNKFCDREILETTDYDGWNIMHYGARYKPTIVKLLLELDLEHNHTCQVMQVPDLLKKFIDTNNVGFTYLHVLAVWNPEHLKDIVNVAKSDTLVIRDSAGRYYYEYLNDEYKLKLNSESEIKYKIVVFPKSTKVICPICYEDEIKKVIISCGHTFCSQCMAKSGFTCLICRGKIMGITNLYLP
jgi:hypothetical protein